jgi:fused signal recognition particle receptor
LVEPTPPGGGPPGVWAKLKRGLFMTHTEILDRVDAAMTGRGVVDEATLAGLEEALVAADLGVAASEELLRRLRPRVRRGEAGDLVRLRRLLAEEAAALLAVAPQPAPLDERPAVVLVAGVNGVGKTTTIAKLARRDLAGGRSVMLAAADTFRAAAGEQLALWAERLGVDVVRQRRGADPAAVVFDALQAARARAIDRVFVDTAGRMHTKEPLMAELAKIGRVIERQEPDWQRRVWLVVDATAGQNALAQAREFVRAVEVDGLVLTKLDGSAKGGVAVPLARELKLPVVALGVGEGLDDLIDFDPKLYAEALLG